MKTQNKKRKGFTLVELLVVIAILAILASVSVVGYVSFTNKAKESNALQEMTQVKTTLLAALADGQEESGAVKFVLAENKITIAGQADVNAAVETVFPELKDLKGTIEGTGDVATGLTALTYTLDGYVATWDITSGNITTAKLQA